MGMGLRTVSGVGKVSGGNPVGGAIGQTGWTMRDDLDDGTGGYKK
jgi:hypothetical protein